MSSIKDQIKIYPNIYPRQKCLEKCLENKINDAAVYLYQNLGKNDEALSLTQRETEKAFNEYLENEKDESYNYFIQQLNLCIKICQDTSESLAKENNNKKGKENLTSLKEGDKLWFDLLKTLYNFEKKSRDKKGVEAKISQNIEDLLRKMCLHVSLQNIIETVTEIQREAQYKEFKNILGDMLRSNNSFNRILKNTKLILKSSIIKSEVELNQSSMRGNCYNNKLCDVCNKNFIKSNEEVINCFGCGHQCHENCVYCNNNYDECVICRRNEISNDDLSKLLINQIDNNNKNTDKNVINKIEHNNDENKKKDVFLFGNRNDKIKKLKELDNKYIEKIIDIF